MNYHIECENISYKYLKVEIHISNPQKKAITLQLPSWRPGRYQIQNFAKNIRNFTATSQKGQILLFKKIKKDAWRINSSITEELIVSYEYYADQKDAGGSYVDSDMLYINPINLLMYEIGKEASLSRLSVTFYKNDKVACGLKYLKEGNTVNFEPYSFHDLVDAPIIISNTLKQHTYFVDQIPFHIWVQGKVDYPWERIKSDFKAFTETQIAVFNEFPEKEYHYLLWVPSHAYYHGVEHFNSTMMVLGPDSQSFDDMYNDLLGLSSHELFHTWNVKKIRPKELLPYQYDRENYFETCFVAEGITTFYGDWMLFRSGVIDKNTFQKELETTLRRHFETADNSTLSLLESSYDLWLDGYEAGAPNRKVSVYHKGAVAAIILNHQLRKYLDSPYPLDLVMLKLWENYGKTGIGYTYKNFKNIIKELTGKSFKKYFEHVIEGNESVLEQCNNALGDFGFKLSQNQEGHYVLNEE
jgi:predicted metalloprotease with PDZ domain